jgi:HEAT repeat protein
MKVFRYLFIPFLVLISSGANAAVEWDEETALAVLASDTEAKARACQALAVVGGPDSVPALAGLLGDEQLASYARTVLEVIEDPSAGEALRGALPNLKGRLLAGVVTSLGVRGDEASVPALQELAVNANRRVAEAALAALAGIGTKDALATVVQGLNQGPAELRVSAAHAALAAAEKMTEQGNSKAAQYLLNAIGSAVLPEHIKQAALALSAN